MGKEVRIGEVIVGGDNPLILIAGPCVIEDKNSTFAIAERIKEIAREVGIPFIFKASYDKANRSSLRSFRGPGLEKGLAILKEIREKLDIPVLTDIHCQKEVEEAAKVADVLQIPAFLSRQTDLLLSAGRTQKPVNIKKGQFLAPWDMKNVVEKVQSTGNERILLTERGTSFGYNNLVSDMRSLPLMRRLGYPVIFDITHSLQLPGGLGKSSGGQREFIPYLARAAVACGCDGIFMEVHPDPDKALSDGPNMLPLDELSNLLKRLKKIDELIKEKE